MKRCILLALLSSGTMFCQYGTNTILMAATTLGCAVEWKKSRDLEKAYRELARDREELLTEDHQEALKMAKLYRCTKHFYIVAGTISTVLAVQNFYQWLMMEEEHEA